MSVDDLKVRLESRNLSILAHGFRNVTKSDYDEFYKIVSPLCDAVALKDSEFRLSN